MIYNLRESYKLYKILSNDTISRKEYLSITQDFMKFIASKLLEKGEVVLPERLGKLQIQGRKSKIKIDENNKIKGLSPDWGKTRELWDSDPIAKKDKLIVYHFNEDTNGVRYKFLWSKRNVLLQNKTLYNLQFSRENKRNLAKKIKEGKEYLIV